MEEKFNPKYPDIEYLRVRAKKKIPRFAFEYLDGGCNTGVNLRRNTAEIREVQLKPVYLRDHGQANIQTELFGKIYDAPFGISPIGLQGLMWPRASEILAQAAFDYNVPFILSTVATASLEKISEITQGNAWFQLYNPVEDALRDDLLRRLTEAGCPVLVILSDVPTFGYRSKEIINGLAIPPRMTLRNILQIMARPHWALQTLLAGTPRFKSLTPYLPKKASLRHLGQFMNRTFSGRLNEVKIGAIRDKWKGKLVLKGVASEEDTETAVKLGLDGIIISNHGGRQLDHGQSTIGALRQIAPKYSTQIKIMIDSGMRTGPDIASVLASGAEFAFLGRSFMYGVSALGREGGNHTISILKKQLTQVLEQLCCDRIEDLANHLIPSET